MRKGVGAIATQGYTETGYGSRGLSLLERGEGPSRNPGKIDRRRPEPEKRQVAIMDCEGEKAVHTGPSCPRKRGSRRGKGFIAVGNMLESKKTVSAMGENFGKSDVKLPSRIIEALKVGAEAGGDRRGNRTAALLVEGKGGVDIRVDSHGTPVEELQRKYRNQGSS